MDPIEEQIVRQRLILANLYTQRNHKFSSIYRFPIETLADIFLQCAGDFYYNHDGGTKRPGWLNISYVCRRWRNVALSCPALWTYIPTMPQCWVEEFLTRSKKAQLKIRIRGYSFGDLRNILEKVMNQLDRVQELDLDVPDTSDISLELSSRALHLTTLQVSVNTGSNMSSPVLFFGNIPVLRTLILTGCLVSWNSVKLNGLTTLSLRDLPVQFQQNIKEFLGTLGGMQELTRLYLINSVPGSREFISGALFNSFRKINLPKLTRLAIEAPTSTVIALLSCVNIPLDTGVRLECFLEGSPSVDDDTLLFSVLAQRLSTSKNRDRTTRSLVVESTGWGPRLTFSALEHGCDSQVGDVDWDWDCNVSLQILLGQRAIDEDLILNMFCTIPLKHVQTAHFVRAPISAAFWRRTLGHLPDLRYLKLSKGKMPQLASILSVAPRNCTKSKCKHGGAGQIYVPALEELELNGIKFPRGQLECDIQVLKNALSTRGCPRVKVSEIGCIQRTSAVYDYSSESEIG